MAPKLIEHLSSTAKPGDIDTFPKHHGGRHVPELLAPNFVVCPQILGGYELERSSAEPRAQFERNANSILFPRLDMRAVGLVMQYGILLGSHFNQDLSKFFQLQVEYESSLKEFGIEVEEIRINLR